MKRSEAVELIAKRLNPIGIADPTCEEILTLLEDAGMLPPLTELDRLSGLKDNAWDPE